MKGGSRLALAQWGPVGWKFLHACTFAYPETPDPARQRQMRAFWDSLPDVLPCGLCGSHLREMLRRSPPPLHSRDELSRWCVDRHNEVNLRLGKATRDYASVAREYGSAAAAAEGRSPWVAMAIVGVVAVVVACSILLRCRRRNHS